MEKQYQRAPYVRYFKQGNNGIFTIGSHQKIIKDPNLWECLLWIICSFEKPKNLKDVKEGAYSKFSKNHVKEAFHILKETHALIQENLYQKEDRYSRCLLYYNMFSDAPQDVQKKLRSLHVVILGCGGIGHYVSSMFVSLGIGEITLIDHDIIEESNLTRQFFFTEDDCGKNKVSILKDALEKRNSQTKVTALLAKITEKEDLEIIPKADIIIASADHPFALISWLNKYALKKRIPYINVGYLNDIAMAGPFVIPGKTSCFHCSDIAPESTQERKDDQTSHVPFYQAPSFPATNAIASSMAVLDVIKYFGSYGKPETLNQRVGFYTSTFHVKRQKIPKNPSCSHCSQI